MADSPVAGFFAELKLKVDQPSFDRGQQNLDSLKVKLKELSGVAEDAGSRITKAFSGIPKSFKLNVETQGADTAKEKARSDFESLFKPKKTDEEVLKDKLSKMESKPTKFDWPGFDRETKNTQEAQTKRIKDQNKEFETSSKWLKSLVGIALSYKAALAAVKMVTGAAQEGQNTVIGAGMMNMGFKDFARLQTAFRLAGKEFEGMEQNVFEMGQAIGQMVTGQNKEDFLKSLSMLGINTERFIKEDSLTQVRQVMSAVAKGITSTNLDQRRIATTVAEQALPGSARLNELLSNSKYRDFEGLLAGADSVMMSTNQTFKSLLDLNVEMNQAGTEFGQIIQKFSQSLAEGGLTSSLKKFNDFYTSNKSEIDKSITLFGEAIGGFLKFLSDFVLSPVGQLIGWAGSSFGKALEDSNSKESQFREFAKSRGVDVDRAPEGMKAQKEWGLQKLNLRREFEAIGLNEAVGKTVDAQSLKAFNAFTPAKPDVPYRPASPFVSGGKLQVEVVVTDAKGKQSVQSIMIDPTRQNQKIQATASGGSR